MLYILVIYFGQGYTQWQFPFLEMSVTLNFVYWCTLAYGDKNIQNTQCNPEMQSSVAPYYISEIGLEKVVSAHYITARIFPNTN